MKHALHIGAFREGKIVDERYAPEKGVISVGRTADNTFSLLGANLPDKYTLVTFERHLPLLHLTAGMTGEIALDGKTRKNIEELRAKGRTQPDGWALELPEVARGWVRLGDTTFFLQQAQKPLPPPKNTLPSVARGGLFGQIDRTLGTVFVIVMALECTAVIMINRQPDLDPDAPLTQEPDRFVTMVKAPDVKKPDDKKPDDKKPDDKKDAKKKDTDTAEQKAAKVSKAVQNSRLLTVLGSMGDNGALANVFAKNGAFSTDISGAFSGVKIATDSDTIQHKGISGDGGPASIGDLSGAAGGGVRGKLGEKQHALQPRIEVAENDVDVESSSIDKDALGKFIRLRLHSIQSCYEHQLKLNPGLKGKIVVRFVVTSAGRVGDASIDSSSMGNSDVESCILRTIRAWAFPFKPDEDAPVIFPFVFQPGG